MGRNIFTRLFLTLSIAIVLLVGVMMIIQSSFFQEYYVQTKTNSIQSMIVTLTEEYEAAPLKNDPDLMQKTAEFSLKNNAQIIFDDLTAGSDNASYGYFVTSSSFDNDFIRENLDYGESLFQQTSQADGDTRVVTFSATDKYGITSVFTVNAVKSGEEITGMLFSVTSLQPVGEAAAVISDYYLLFFVAAIVIIVIISWLLSRQIARPLVEMNNAAIKMARLDFSRKCPVKSRDEIGNLGRTLNFLSEHLDRTISDLQESNQKLTQELAKQKELEIMRREFVAGVSHELKTPVSVIRGYAEGAADAMENGVLKKDYLDVIIDETDKINALVSDMLDLAQLEHSHITIKFESISLNRLIRYVVDKMALMIKDKNLDVRTVFENQGMIALGDGFRIEQVLVNLLNNAIRFTPPGGWITIKVRQAGVEDSPLPVSGGRQKYEIRSAVNPLEAASSRLWIEIENSGDPISTQDLERIWEKFYRIEKSRNRQSGGTGLGLSIVKNVLSLHNSTFGVVNTPDGVKFYFSLEQVNEQRDNREQSEN